MKFKIEEVKIGLQVIHRLHIYTDEPKEYRYIDIWGDELKQLQEVINEYCIPLNEGI